MKAVLITFNQAHREDIDTLMVRLNIKGFTGWETLIGAGSKTGEPHLGSHAWPTLNSAYVAMVEDSIVDEFLAGLKALDNGSKQLGLRAFVWNVEQSI